MARGSQEGGAQWEEVNYLHANGPGLPEIPQAASLGVGRVRRQDVGVIFASQQEISATESLRFLPPKSEKSCPVAGSAGRQRNVMKTL